MLKFGSVISACAGNYIDQLQDELDNCICSADDLAKGLQIACSKGNYTCAKCVIEAGAKIDFHDRNGATPLSQAAEKGHRNILKLLLDNGANVNKPSLVTLATPLHWAVAQDHMDCVKTLVESGANLEARTHYGRTPMMIASKGNQDVMLQYLLYRGSKIDVKDNVGATALHLAADQGCPDCVRILLKKGANINATTTAGDTPLTKASKSGNASIVQLLLNKDAIALVTFKSLTAFHWAAAGGHTGCIRYLLDTGMNPDCPSPKTFCGSDYFFNAGSTPLMLAARKGYLNVLKQLLSTGKICIDREDADGQTALLYAIHDGHLECVEYLLKSGANPNGVTDSNPFKVQLRNKDDDYYDDEHANFRDELQNVGVSLISLVDRPIYMAMRHNYNSILCLLIRWNCDLKIDVPIYENEFGTPIEMALFGRNLTQIQILLEAGAEKSIKNKQVLLICLEWLLNKDEKSAVYLMESMCNPMSLSNLSRSTIRQFIRKDPVIFIGQLPLPQFLKRFVDYQGLHEFLND